MDAKVGEVKARVKSGGDIGLSLYDLIADMFRAYRNLHQICGDSRLQTPCTLNPRLRMGPAVRAPAHFVSGRSIQCASRRLLIALPFGVASVIGVLVFMIGVRFGKISTSWLVISLSAAVPAIGSVVLYHEPVKGKKVAVLVLAIVSVLLLLKDKQDDERKQAAIPVTVQGNS